MKTKKFFKSLMTLVTVAFVVSLLSCASTSKKVATLEETNRMFWTLDGTDSKGNPSTIYFLGTIHLGDERLYPLPNEVVEALFSSDRIVAEISSDDMNNLQVEILKLMTQSLINAKGRKVFDYLDEEQIDALTSILGDNVNVMSNYEPWVLNNLISTAIYINSGLDAAYGMDNNLMAMLMQNEIDWEGLDELQTQLDILCFGDYDQQLIIFKSTLDQIINSDEVNEYVNTMYETYLSGDVDKFEQVLSEDPSENDLSADADIDEFNQKYKKAVFNDRNEAWAKKIKKYLANGGTTFIFAGSGHFVGDDSVFDQLKKIGVIN